MGNATPNSGMGPTDDPPSGPWISSHLRQPAPRARTWPTTAFAAIATLLGAAALGVALLRSTGSPAPAATARYTPEESTAAHRTLCDAYSLASRAVQIETNGTSPERAGIAEINGAMMLDDAVNGAAGLTPSDRAAAVALARAYTNLAAVASLNDNLKWQSALNDANAKNAVMQKVCNGG